MNKFSEENARRHEAPHGCPFIGARAYNAQKDWYWCELEVRTVLLPRDCPDCYCYDE
jgi:hypothetical protein